MKIIYIAQGERRFFRVCMKWLAQHDKAAAQRNLQYTALFGRWDDFYLFIDTPLEDEMFQFLKEQLALDVQCQTPSLLAKWLKSINTSSKESRELGERTRKAFGMTAKQYRKTLSILRERINVLERLMSAGQWDQIEYDKIPSRAGFLYRNAFAKHDVERVKAGKETYTDFAKDESATVNAKVLYPYEVVVEARKLMGSYWHNANIPLDDTQRLMINKYWANLTDYFNEAVFDGLAVVDVSGSMMGPEASSPINVAISLGMYCAEKARGPFANHFMTFSSNPTLLKVDGIDFCDKVRRMGRSEWGMNTDIEAAFDLMLKTAIENHCTQEELPHNLIVISDMEFDSCTSYNCRSSSKETLFETMKKKWAIHGYQMPNLVFWNCSARHDLIPVKDDGYVRYVSGMSPVIFEQVMKDLNAYDLMMDKLNNKRYECIQ